MEQRNPLLQTILSLFVPFYIYYWTYVTSKGLERVYRVKAPSIALLLAPIFAVGFAFILLVLTLPLSSFSNAENKTSFVLISIMTISLSMLFIVCFLLSFVYYYKFGKQVEKSISPDLTGAITLLLYIFIAPAIVFIIQDRINRPQPTSPSTLPPLDNSATHSPDQTPTQQSQ